ncbi:MAG: DUF3187 family protein [Chitinophagaceae bacterium]|nr:DUF3187 family protein [Oligoflexus sp.]
MKVVIFVLIGITLSGHAFSEELSYVPDPLILRSEALSQMFRSSPITQKFRLGEAGDWRVSAGRTYANFWGHDKRYVIDTEMKDDQLLVFYQPLANLEVYGGYSDRGFSRMGTDSLAIGFHHLFGLPQDGRLDAKRENVRLSVPDYDLNYSILQKNTSLSRKLEGGLVWDFARAFALRFPMTLAVYSTHESARFNPYFTGATDIGSKLSMALPLGDTSLYGSLSYTVFDGTQESDLATYGQQWGGVFGAAQRFDLHSELFLQFLVYQPLFRDMGQLSRSSYEVHLAYRYKWEQLSFELGLIENIFWVYNSPDWGLSAAITYHSKP